MTSPVERTASKNLQPLFTPRSVAIVGCSPTSSGKLGSWPLKNLLIQQSKVDIYPVNPSRTEIDGIKSYSSLDDLPVAPDVVLVMLPAQQAIGVVRQADAMGAGSAIVFSAGFGETVAGEVLEAELRTLAASTAMPVCGPNTDGIINVVDGIPCGFPPYAAITPRPIGDVGVVSQSGALVSTLVMRLMRNGLGLSYSCAIGNAVDIGMADYIRYLVDDARTSTILAYAEGITDRDAFIAAADAATDAGKLVVVLKGGRSDAGSAAAQSHTGAMVGAYDAFEALCAAHGIVAAHNLEEFAALPLLHRMARRIPRDRRRSVGVVSGSGAVGGHVVDKAVEHGFDAVEFAPATLQRLTDRLEFTTPRNPIDLTGQVVHDPALHVDVLNALSDDPGVGFLAAGSLYGPADITDRLKREIVEVAALTPMFVHSADGNDPRDEPILTNGNVPVLPSADLLFGCLSKLVDVMVRQEQTKRAGVPVDIVRRDKAEAILRTSTSETVTSEVAAQLLALYDIGAMAQRTVDSGEAAVEAANAIGYPVALKVDSPDAQHKSDLGLIQLGVSDAGAVTAAFAHLMDLAARHGLRSAHAVVQQMSDPGVEVLVGMRNDREFGTFVVVGGGGVFTEILADRVIAPAPITEYDVADLLPQLKMYPLLQGARGSARSDTAALARLIANFSQMASDLGHLLGELELNPVIVTPTGAAAVDLLAVQSIELRN